MPRTKKIKEDEDLGKKYFDIISPKSEEELVEEIMETPKKQDEELVLIRKESFSKKEKQEEVEEQEEIEEEETKEAVEEDTYEKTEEEIEPVTYRERFEAPSIRADVGTKFEAEDEIETTYEEDGKKKKFHFKMKNKIFVVAIGCFVLTGLVMGLYTFAFNKAEVIVTTRKSTVKYEGVVIADVGVKSVDANKGIIPGRAITISKTLEKEYSATGKVSGGARATGKMLIYNAYSQSPQVLVTGTRFESADGLIFKLNARTVVPGAILKNGDLEPTSIEADVTAEESGKAYNMAPGRFTIPGFKGGDKFKGFYGETKAAMAGGSEGESVVVSPGDLKSAETAVGNDLMNMLNEELNKQVGKDERIFKEGVVIKIFKPTPLARIGDSVPKFKFSIQGEIKTIVVANKDLDELIKTNLGSSLKAEDGLYGNPVYVFTNLKFDATKGNISFFTACDYPAKKNLNMEEILELVKGKGIAEVKKTLSNNAKIENTRIILHPFWLNEIPVEKQKIVLTLD